MMEFSLTADLLGSNSGFQFGVYFSNINCEIEWKSGSDLHFLRIRHEISWKAAIFRTDSTNNDIRKAIHQNIY